MSTLHRHSAFAVPDFFTEKFGLDAKDFWYCLGLVHSRYRDCSTIILPAKCQGGCSYTFVVNNAIVVQFRLLKYAIDWGLACDARDVYGKFAPRPLRFDRLTGRGLQICEMTMLGETTCSEALPVDDVLEERDLVRLEILLGGLAKSFARGWKRSGGRRGCGGKIGSTLERRLRKLVRELPTFALRNIARDALLHMKDGGLQNLPITLNHGDLLPTNIIVDRDTWELKGLVDWAEAEYLPFGMNLYGVEHLLGTLQGHVFQHYQQADSLRDHFWKCLCRAVPELRKTDVWQAIQLSRVIGILLWRGFAWDDGKLDRVVRFQTDEVEVAYLQAFLDFEVRSKQSKL